MQTSTNQQCTNNNRKNNLETLYVPSACPFANKLNKSNSTVKSAQPHARVNRILGHMGGGDKLFELIPTPAVFDQNAYQLHNHKYITSLHTQLGDVFRLPIGGSDMVFVRNPKSVKRVLTSEDEFTKTFADADEKSSSYLQYFKNLVQPLLNSAQIFGSADNFDRRQNLKKVFLASQTFLPGFQNVLSQEIGNAPWPSSGRTDLVPLLHPLIFRLVVVIMAGEDAEGADALMAAAVGCLAYFERRYSQPLFEEKINKQDEEHMAVVEAAAMKVTKAFYARLEAGTLSAMGKASMLARLLECGLTQKEVNATMINSLFAACEAPVHVLGAVLVQLSKMPALQTKLAAELRGAQGATLLKNKLLDGVVLEALRLFSPVTLVQRRTTADLVMQGFHVPAGTNFGVCISSVHANEEFFPNASEFDPSRKLNITMLSSKHAFMPFSAGPRGCPGRYLASAVLKSAIAHMLQTYSLGESSNIEAGPTAIKIHKFVEFPTNGLFVDLQPRTF